MNAPLTENPDLAWEISEGIDRDLAIDFVMRFETTLCVYSPSVHQLYSTYSLFFPEENDRKMVILPDPSAFHDTFHGIPEAAVAFTGLYIVPGELVGKSGLYLANVNKDRSLSKRQIPFVSGMRAIQKKRAAADPFLPVLAKGDLRQFQESWPVLHLHRIKLDALTEHSDLDRQGIRNSILEKLDALFIEQGRPGG